MNLKMILFILLSTNTYLDNFEQILIYLPGQSKKFSTLKNYKIYHDTIINVNSNNYLS